MNNLENKFIHSSEKLEEAFQFSQVSQVFESLSFVVIFCFGFFSSLLLLFFIFVLIFFHRCFYFKEVMEVSILQKKKT